MGIQKLMSTESKSTHSLFSRESGRPQVEAVRTYLKKRPPKSCQSLLGFTLTRRVPFQIKISDELSVPKLSESFVVQMTQGPFRSKGFGLKFQNYKMRGTRTHQQLLLPFNGEFRHDFDTLSGIISASAAFPLAFEPEKIPHCLTPIGSSSSECKDKDTIETEFIDGGLYDNLPLRSAVLIAKEQYKKDIPILLLDPSLYDFPVPNAIYASVSPSRKDDNANSPYLFRFLGEISSSLIQSARRTMVTRLVEEDPGITKRIAHSTAKVPLSGSGMNAFMGFFERLSSK